MSQNNEYKTPSDKGRAQYGSNGKVNNGHEGYKQIRVHLIFDVKHNSRHKARLVADGSLTTEPAEPIYSSMVSLRKLRLSMRQGQAGGRGGGGILRWWMTRRRKRRNQSPFVV